MHNAPLGGKAILVTRPRTQSRSLSRAIERHGGVAVDYPVIEILPGDADTVAAIAAELPAADIAVFVSRNAAELGAGLATSAKTAAIGPATAAALTAAGRHVDAVPGSGFDSESLLEEPLFHEVSGLDIWIVRADSGREFLAASLRARGANVHYLPVYRRQQPIVDSDTQESLQSQWLAGGIHAVTAMSVESLCNMLALLPPACSSRLAELPLVTPATRVIKELLQRYPTAQPVLAADPSADAMIDAILAALQMDPESQNE